MRLGLQLTIRQTNVPQSGYPLTVNVSPMQAESFHGSHARAKTFLEVLAAFLQTPESFSRPLQRSCKPQKVFRGTCSVPANAKKFFEALAGFPAFAETFAQAAQVSRHLPRRLRRLREAPGIYRDVCAGCARLPAFAETFAELPQTPKSFSRHLQRSCKDQKVSRGICSIPAKTKKFLGAFAALLQSISKSSALPLGLYQRHSSGIRILILSPNSRLECVSYRFSA